MSKRLYQYEAMIPEDYSKFAVEKMTKIMKVEFDINKYNRAIRNEEYTSPECICVFRDQNNDERFVMLDTNGPNFVYDIVIRCTEEEHEFIKKSLLETVNYIRKEYGYQPISDMINKYDEPDNKYSEALKRCGVDRMR